MSAQLASGRWSRASVGVWIAKLVLGGVFLVAGVEKLADPATFSEQIANYQLLPQLAPYLATALPGLEVLLGALLIASPAPGPWLRASALVTGALMVVFTAAVFSVVLRGIDVDCGCFSASGAVSWWTVARDVALLGMAGWVFVKAGRGAPALA